MGEKCPDYRDVLISGMGKCTSVPFGTVIILNSVLPFRRGGLPQGKVPVVIPNPNCFQNSKLRTKDCGSTEHDRFLDECN